MPSRARFALVTFTLTVVDAAAGIAQQQVPAPRPADLVLRGADSPRRSSSGSAGSPPAGTIIALSNAEVARFIGPATQVIELRAASAIPAIEGHAHFTGIGETASTLDLMATSSWDQIVTQVALAVEKRPRGGRDHRPRLAPGQATPRPEPNARGLSARTPRRCAKQSVILTHASGHASFVNAKALEPPVTSKSANPTGGDPGTERRAHRLMRETAAAPSAVRRINRGKEVRRQLQLADEEVTSKGITTVHDAGSSFATLDIVRRMIDEGRMRVRLWMMIRAGNADLQKNVDAYHVVGYGNNQLTVRAIKVTADGALGSRGAWLLEPYTDKPDSTGLTPAAVQTLPDTAQIAVRHAAFRVHAIGDRANREVLNIYRGAFKKNTVTALAARRIEHAQHISAADIPRFGQLGVIASMQTITARRTARGSPTGSGRRAPGEGATGSR
jgi:predicted amidohydrolase YtcJ